MFISQQKRVNQKSYNINQKREILSKLENKSKRECEKELIKISPLATIPQDRERLITEEKIEVKFVITKELKEKLDKSRCQNALPLVEVKNSEAQQVGKESANSQNTSVAKTLSNTRHTRSSMQSNPLTINPIPNSRYIPAYIKRQVWQRDQGRCQYQSTNSAQKCNSTYFIQIDHVTPFSHGGSSTDINNLRLLCANHNRYRWE